MEHKDLISTLDNSNMTYAEHERLELDTADTESKRVSDLDVRGEETKNYWIPNEGVHVQTFKARVLDWDSRSVKTEWLIDKEEERYQVRYFPIQVLKKRFLKHNQFLQVMLFIKAGEIKLKFEDGTRFVLDGDFPETKIRYNPNSPLFKFK